MTHEPFIVESRPNHRNARFAQRVLEELSLMLPKDLRDPRLQEVPFITVLGVDLSVDYRHATIRFSTFIDDKKIAGVSEALNDAAGFLRRELMHRLQTKITPHLRFVYDKGLVSSSKIDKLFQGI